MHEAFWNGLLDVRWEDAPLGAETIRLVLRLRECGYAERTCRDYGHAVIHLGRVLREETGSVEGVRDDAVIEDFLGRHLLVCCCYRRPGGRRQEQVRRGLAHLRAMLREEGALPAVVPDEPPYQGLIEGYCRFLRWDRGLAETTVVNYRRYLRDFLASRGDAVSPAELAALTAEDLLMFSRRRGARLGRTAWNHLATSLSGFYRWLDLQGHPARHLAGAVPLRRRYRLADVPCALSWEQVQRLLAVAGRDAPGGRRNYAMLLLIASYGLRGCEVRALRLSDIDWVHDEITIFAPKTGRRRRLPLTRPVGEAILDYLLADRPPSPHEEVFLSSRPPHGPLRSKMNPWLGCQLDKAGIVTPRRGAHILRHSLAVHLLRSGETLKSIGDVLGHRHPDTTFIYTKAPRRGSPDGGIGAGGGVVTTGGFCGPLASEFAAFAATLEASASANKTTLTQLRALDRFTRQHGLPSGTIDETLARAWLAGCESRGPNTRRARYYLLRRFCRHLSKRRPDTFVPGESLRPRGRPPKRPHIYSREEIRRLLDGALTLRDWTRGHPCPIRSKTMRTIILLLVTSGLRISEALHLSLQDVDLAAGVLSIRQSKFRKSRLVPVSAGTLEELRRYHDLRLTVAPADPGGAFFVSGRGTAYSPSTVQAMFRDLTIQSGLRGPHGRGPRLHDLRATFAVTRLLQWYRDGEDVMARLPLLSTYLGHASVTDTEVYLAITAALLQEANTRFHHFTQDLLPAPGGGQP